jgi:hypothetical protein
MTPETKPDGRGVPRPPDQVSPGDRILIHENDGIVAIGRVIDLDGVLHCQGSTPGALHRLGIRDQYVRLLRPPNHVRIPDGTPVRLRLFDPEWATVEREGTIKAALKAEDAMRYNVRYQVPKGFANLDGHAVALGVHPDDIELRPTGEDEPKFAPDATSPHLVNEMSTALRDVSRLAVRNGANEARTVYHQVVEALSLTEQRVATEAQEIARGKLRHEVEQLLTNYDAPKPDHWGIQRGDVMEWLSRALQIGRGHARERDALAKEMTKLGASPAHSVTQMFEFVIAKTRAEARSNATAHAEQAASAKIRKLEKTIHDAFQYLNDQIPGIEGLTLDQKLREVVCDLRNKLAFAELHRGRQVVIAGVDQVRAVIERAVDGVPVELVEDLGGWFLRALAAANLAVIRHDWNGLDPTAEPVEPAAEPVTPDKPSPPTLDDVKAAWGTVVAEFAKVPEALRQAMADVERKRPGGSQ